MPLNFTVLVRNHHGMDLRVYVMETQGPTRRLGIAPRFGSAKFALPPVVSFPAELRFYAVPLGTAEPQESWPIVVERAMSLMFTVEAVASLSTVSKLP